MWFGIKGYSEDLFKGKPGLENLNNLACMLTVIAQNNVTINKSI